MYLASCSLDVIGNAPFYSSIPSRHIVLPDAECVTARSLFLAISNTSFIAKGNNVFLWISGHILGLLRRTQNLLQLVDAIATGDRCSINTINMTYHAVF